MTAPLSRLQSLKWKGGSGRGIREALSRHSRHVNQKSASCSRHEMDHFSVWKKVVLSQPLEVIILTALKTEEFVLPKR
jgi:hypothetical protein